MNKPDMEEGGIPQLLFDLANADRFALLNHISAGGHRMSELTKLINASQPECSRHLARLTEAGLIRRGGGGLFEATAVGKTILKLFPGIQMVIDHRSYFLTHDLSFLPGGFLERIGALSSGTYVDHISGVLEHIKTVVSGAREHVWMISDKLFPQWPGIGETFASKDIAVRVVSAQTINPKVLTEYKAHFTRSEIGTLKDVKIAMAISETTAGVCFPTLDGVIDWSGGFGGSEPGFRTWCADLFDYYWSKASRTFQPSPFQ